MKHLCVLACLVTLAPGLASAQSTISTCVASAVPPLLRSEGLAERIGDLVYHCTGVANTTLTGNFSVQLNTSITNRISSGTTLTGIIFTTDSGSGPQPVTVQPLLVNRNTLVYNGVPVTFSALGAAELRIAGVRGNATQLGIGSQIVAALAINAAGLGLTTSQLVAGTPQRSLYASFSRKLIATSTGSPLPDPITIPNLLAVSQISSTRMTEGIADAFGTATAFNGLNADSGQRIIVRYGAIPAGARLFVPDVIAGSNAVAPTSGGDLGLAGSGGAYEPATNRSLLLARVNGADANGAGGMPGYTPGPIGSGVVSFDSVTELTTLNGNAYVVYEVVDSNDAVIESAQFPTFLGLAPDSTRTFTEISASVYLAPTSTAAVSSVNDPLPRFVVTEPPSDCTIIGDCSAVQPQLVVDTTPQQLTAVVGGATAQSFFTLRNGGGGTLRWSAAIGYGTAGGWLSLDPIAGTGGVNVRVFAAPGKLGPGTYQAAISIDAGTAGSRTVFVTFVVTATPVAPRPAINAVVSAASFVTVPVVPGSLTTLIGSGLTGNQVFATFDGFTAVILYNDGSQINLLVPTSITGQSLSQLTVTVDGVSSVARTVQVAAFSPAIFSRGILNQDYSANDANHRAEAGSVIQIFLTGASGAGAITAHLHDREIFTPYYAGPAPSLLGVQQVNLVIPAGLGRITTEVYVCGTDAAGAKNCSVPSQVYLQ